MVYVASGKEKQSGAVEESVNPNANTKPFNSVCISSVIFTLRRKCLVLFSLHGSFIYEYKDLVRFLCLKSTLRSL